LKNRLKNMEKDSKIYIAGHTGLVGRSLEKALKKEGYKNILISSHGELDLRNQNYVQDFFEKERPEYVFFAAGKVGGITANVTYPAEFIYDNLAMQTNVINSSWKNNVKKLMYFGSCCAYPTESNQSIKEDDLFRGKLEPTNEPFAVAKLAGIRMCQAYNKQYGCNFISVMPSNLYGPNDNFHPQNAHVIGSAMNLIHNAKENNLKSVTFGGTGAPVRDWLYVDDLADACLFLMQNYDSSELINIGTGVGTSKKDIVYQIKDIEGFNGQIIFDSTKPDGMMKRVLDVEKINSLGWKAKTNLEDGIKRTYEWFLENKA
jgi:GDP-L-fucose synthase